MGEDKMNGKPVTDNMKIKANALYKFLRANDRFCTKAEIGEYLGLADERAVRDVIATLATKKPILSNSSGKGYKLAQTLQDLEEVKHTWKELDKRIASIEERKKPLIEFYEKIRGTK